MTDRTMDSVDSCKSRQVPRINIEADSSNHLSLGKVRDVLAYTKCKLCQKMYFHCRHCKHRCHKKCPGHTHQKSSRRSTNSKIYTGDEHWTKVLQANEVLGPGVISCPYHSRRSRRGDATPDRPPDASSPDCASRTQPRCSRSNHSTKDPSSASPSSSVSSSAAAGLKDKTFLHTIYTRFCQWIDSTRKDAGTLHRLNRSTSPKLSRRSSLDGNRGKASPEEMAYDLAALLAEKAASVSDPSCHRALSSSDSELGSAGASFSSTCSSLTVTSTSTTTSDCCPSCGVSGGMSSAQMSDCSNHDDGFLSDDVALSGSSVCGSCTAVSAYQRDQFLHTVNRGATKLGWPRTSEDADWYGVSIDRDDEDDRDGFDGSHASYCDEYLRESLVDWNIPIADVELAECLRKGVKHDIFRGRWHGDVFIYTFNRSSDADVAVFLREVTRLSKIRHENICLFMGACLQSPHLAVITSELKGISVYDKLHLSSDRIPMRSRVNIGRQVAQAMGYLHAKGITAQVLNSRNIYLEPKVKLSLLDQGMPEEKHNTRSNEICVPRGNLTYLAPEILRDFRFGCNGVSLSCDAYSTTVHTDVFAFGTLLYELLSGQFPFRGLLLEEILWQVCNGHRQTLANICCNTVLKVLIERCWAENAEDRPPFCEINQELQQKTGLHKRHSSSQPERLDRQNSFSEKCLL